MASEQIMSKAITRAVAEATRIAIQTIMQRLRWRGHPVHIRAQDRQSCYEATNMLIGVHKISIAN